MGPWRVHFSPSMENPWILDAGVRSHNPATPNFYTEEGGRADNFSCCRQVWGHIYNPSCGCSTKQGSASTVHFRRSLERTRLLQRLAPMVPVRISAALFSNEIRPRIPFWATRDQHREPARRMTYSLQTTKTVQGYIVKGISSPSSAVTSIGSRNSLSVCAD